MLSTTISFAHHKLSFSLTHTSAHITIVMEQLNNEKDEHELDLELTLHRTSAVEAEPGGLLPLPLPRPQIPQPTGARWPSELQF